MNDPFFREGDQDVRDLKFYSALRHIEEKNTDLNEIRRKGKEILDFYENTVNTKGGLFVWAAGNRGDKDKALTDVSLQAGLPKYYRDLEKGWIAVVGLSPDDINNENRINVENRNHRLAYAGDAAWWTISANYKTLPGINGKSGVGSSFATPRVSAAGALIAEKFPWMTVEQIRQTLFTTTDQTDLNINFTKENEKRRSALEPDSKYGWGMLNTERALKGPGAFLNTLSQYEHSSLNKDFKANIPKGTVSYFENDIYGDGGLEKLGNGTLHLTGNNVYTGNSKIKEGVLEVHSIHSSGIDVEKEGTLVLHSKAIVGYQQPYITFIDKDDIKSENIIAKNIENKGSIEIKGKTSIIGGDLNTYAGSKIIAEAGNQVNVLGNINIKDTDLVVTSNEYIAEPQLNKLMSAKNIEGKFSNVSINGMKNVNVLMDSENISLELSRANAVEYLGNGEESSKNSAKNIENTLKDIDKKIKSGEITLSELKAANSIQMMSKGTFSEAAKKISGEIYATAQSVTFSQSQDINRNLSNHLSNINNLNSSSQDWQAWVSSMGSDGKIKKNGYATADTKVVAGQMGIEKKINEKTIFGTSLAYSYGTADFNNYAGNSKTDMVGISFYGKKELINDFYTSGRIGISKISSRVKRELVDSLGNNVNGNIKHHDYMTSLYAELGKEFNYLTPYVAYSHDYLKRGKFSESNANWGINAGAKNYFSSNIILGLRANYSINKYKIQAYMNHSINVGKRNLDYEGNFTGNSTKHTFKGIGLSKNMTWAGVGVFKEITENLGINLNIDTHLQENKSRGIIYSTELQYKF